jgi:hypothetical protein
MQPLKNIVPLELFRAMAATTAPMRQPGKQRRVRFAPNA